jgi:uncharacterized SAM-binding protein YcdF (DUF218 family)
MSSVIVHKLLSFPLLPLGAALMCLAAALRWRGRTLVAAALAILIVFSNPMVGSALLESLESRYPRMPVERAPNADAVFPLGGMLDAPGGPGEPARLDEEGERFERALQLYLAGRAPILLLSAARNADPRLPGEGEVLRAMAIARGAPPAAILVTRPVPDTAAEAEALREIAVARHWRRVLLVTSAFHMPRAMRALRRCPVELIPVPVAFAAQSRPLGIERFLPDSKALTRSERALREYWGMLFYSVSGRD